MPTTTRTSQPGGAREEPWIELRVGTPVYRGEELLFQGTDGGLMLLPPSDGWLAWFPEFGDFELYVDIAAGATRTNWSATMVDLDLDVIRRRSGEIELLDVDEFEVHQIELDYPEDLIAHARGMAEYVLSAVRAGDTPFDGAAAHEWARRLKR